MDIIERRTKLGAATALQTERTMFATFTAMSGYLSGLLLALALAMGMSISTQALGGEPMFDPQSDGSDGALVVNQNTVINLALAPTGSWMDPAPMPGLGVYDPTIWAVVFKYASVQINAGELGFLNHPSGAPVVWLVQGSVVIESGATVSVAGGFGAFSNFSIPGPGGFAGGKDTSGGFGPGAGGLNQGGEYGSGGRSYGSSEIRPLIGGSGGGGLAPLGGGAGGGAILVAADSISVFGVINARGGGGNTQIGPDAPHGSGGAIRLVANTATVAGSSRLNVLPGSGGSGVGGTPGRIRIESNTLIVSADAAAPNGFPHYTTALPGPLFQDEFTPTVRLVSVNGVAISDDPLAGVQSIDAGINNTNSTITLAIDAWNVEPGSIIQVTAQQAQGNHIVGQSTPLTGSIVFSTATAEITLNSGIPADIVLRVLP